MTPRPPRLVPHRCRLPQPSKAMTGIQGGVWAWAWAWALSWRGCCNTDEGGLAGSRRGGQVRGRDQAGTGRGISWSPEAPRRHLRCPSPRMVGVRLVLYLLSGCTVPGWTKTVWPFAVAHGSAVDGREAVSPSGQGHFYHPGVLAAPASRGHAAVAEAQLSPGRGGMGRARRGLAWVPGVLLASL